MKGNLFWPASLFSSGPMAMPQRLVVVVVVRQAEEDHQRPERHVRYAFCSGALCRLVSLAFLVHVLWWSDSRGCIVLPVAAIVERGAQVKPLA